MRHLLHTLAAAVAVAAMLTLAGCSNDFFEPSDSPPSPGLDLQTAGVAIDEAPRSASRPVLRHPALLDRATSTLKEADPERQRRLQRTLKTRVPEARTSAMALDGPGGLKATSGSGSTSGPNGFINPGVLDGGSAAVALETPSLSTFVTAGDDETHLFLAFREYEPDGVTPRVLDQWGITQRVLQEYGVTRRVLQEYGITQRVLQEYGITQRVLQEYGGLTLRLLEDYGITQRVMQEYDVTPEELEAEIDARESAVRLRLRVSKARPGISVSFGSDLLDALLLELGTDPDVEFAEPDAEMEGGSFFLRNGFKKEGQMVPWNSARIRGVFTDFDSHDIRIFLLDSGIYDRDLDIAEAKDFTMLFTNRDQELWEEDDFERMDVFDPGEMGDPVDRTGHGSHVAGTIGAKNNGEGIRGIAPGAQIHSLKVLTDQGRTDVTTVVAALDYVTDFKQRNPLLPVIANLSLGMDIETTAYNVLDEAVKRATQFGVTVVVSAGNNGEDASTYSPAHVAEAITVGAYDQQDQFASFSNYGPVVDLLAPGAPVVSLTHLESEADEDENILMTGTSMAAPHVTAAAALYLSQNPLAKPHEVRAALVGYSQAGIAGVPEGTTDRSVWLAFADDGETEPFEFDKAEYDRENATLKLEGDGPRLDRVTFYSGSTGEEIASTFVMEDGHFRLVLPQNGDALFPCSVTASYAGPTMEGAAATLPIEIKGAHGALLTDCVQPLAFTKAEWDDGKDKLKFEGTAPQGFEIAFTDASSGQQIATLMPDNKGKFKFDQENLSVKPCVLRATLPSGLATEFPVDDAAADCGSGSGTESPVEVSKAEWDKERGRLTIEGQARGSALVTVTSASSSYELGTDDANNDGAFKLDLRDPLVLPCQVRLTTNDGREAFADVIDNLSGGAPSKCEAPLDVNKVEWNEDHQALKVEATGSYFGDLKVINGRDNGLLHTLTFDDEGKISTEIENPAVVPCSVVLESDGVTRSMEVEDAPLYCDRDLTLADVQWVGATRTLSVSGTASATTPVTLVNANTDQVITTTDAQTSGAYGFSLKLTEGTEPPCRIRVEATNGMAFTENVPTRLCNPDFVFDGGDEEEIEQNPYSFVTIGKAEFKDGGLVLEGKGYVDMAVSFRNPVTGESFGGTRTGTTSQVYTHAAPVTGTIPCTIEAESDGRIAVAEVNGAPDNCNDRPVLYEAEWDEGSLLIEAIGGPGMSLQIVNPAFGTFYTAVFGTDGALNLNLDTDDLDWTPCSVRLESNGQMMEMPVDGAPVFCDDRAWIDFGKAKWDKGKLLLEGEGLDGQGQTRSTITFTDAATGAVIHTDQTDNGGEWDIAVRNLDTIPCEVTVTLDNGSATLAVERAPGCGN